MRHIDLSISSNGSIDSKLSLSQEILKMIEKSNVDSIFHVNTFHTGHVSSYFRRCLTEAHDTVVKESPGVAVSRVGVIETCKKKTGESTRHHKHAPVGYKGISKEVWVE